MKRPSGVPAPNERQPQPADSTPEAGAAESLLARRRRAAQSGESARPEENTRPEDAEATPDYDPDATQDLSEIRLPQPSAKVEVESDAPRPAWFGWRRGKRLDEPVDTDPLAPERAGRTLRAAKRERKRWEKSEVRRFTVRSRRRRRNWLVGVGSVVGVGLLALLLAYTPIMSVRTIAVEGADRVSAEALAQDLAGQKGTPFPFVDSSAIKAVVTGYPLVESYQVISRPPSTLIIRIIERTPVAVVASSAGFSLVDAAGVVVDTVPERPEGFPLVEVDPGEHREAFRAAAAVLRSMPEELRTRVATITAATRDDVSFVLHDSTATVLWGDASNGIPKSKLLEALSRAQPEAKHYNVTSTEIGVVGQ